MAIPVVFVHGLWIHSAAWAPWEELFQGAGYAPIAPGWPGDGASVAQTRAESTAVAGYGLDEITESYAKIISSLPTTPIVIGHSFGGLIAQKLLAQGAASAAVAIDPGPIKGVKPVPLSQVRVGTPVLRRPGNKKRAIALSRKQFRYGFGNTLTENESDQLFERWAVPGPGKPLFEAVSANFRKSSPAGVDTALAGRGPLLFVAGGKDHTAPQVVVEAAHKLYAGSPAVTDLRVFPDRGHSLVFDHGWREIADEVLGWLARQKL